MKREEALKLTENAMETLASALEQGDSQSLTTYLETMARFHQYSFCNSLMIHWQRPDATRVAGFHAWKKLGRSVKKGERGIAILAPMISKGGAAEKAEQLNGEDEHSTLKVLRGFRVVYVFDVSQTDGQPLASIGGISGTPGEHLERLRHLIAERGIELVYEYLFGGAEGRSEGGVIRVRPNLDESKEFSVLVHELAHELMHKEQATRPRSAIVRETEAEAVAFVVCTGFGMDTCARSADYIRLWQGDQKLLLASLERVRFTAADILDSLAERSSESAEAEITLGAAA